MVESQLGRKVLCLHGGVPKTQRGKIIQQWEETSGAVLCAQLFIAGVGLNLQKMCNTAIFLLRWFNVPMETQVHTRTQNKTGADAYPQAIGRICRFGQKYSTNVHFLRYNCYIEIDWIDSIHAQKQAEQRMLLDGCGEDEDELEDMHLSYCERLRMNLDVTVTGETSLQRPIEQHDADEYASNLQQKRASEDARVQHSTHSSKKQRRAQHD